MKDHVALTVLWPDTNMNLFRLHFLHKDNMLHLFDSKISFSSSIVLVHFLYNIYPALIVSFYIIYCIHKIHGWLAKREETHFPFLSSAYFTKWQNFCKKGSIEQRYYWLDFLHDMETIEEKLMHPNMELKSHCWLMSKYPCSFNWN